MLESNSEVFVIACAGDSIKSLFSEHFPDTISGPGLILFSYTVHALKTYLFA